jgi:hypothetical protein
MITQADKEKTTMLADVNKYTMNVHMFLTENNFPTDKYQKTLHKTMQKSNLILDKHKKKHLLQKKPSSPVLRWV